MRHLASVVERALTPCITLSDCRLNKHRLINSLGTKIPERGWDLPSGQIPQRFLTPKISRILSESLTWEALASPRLIPVLRRAGDPSPTHDTLASARVVGLRGTEEAPAAR